MTLWGRNCDAPKGGGLSGWWPKPKWAMAETAVFWPNVCVCVRFWVCSRVCSVCVVWVSSRFLVGVFKIFGPLRQTAPPSDGPKFRSVFSPTKCSRMRGTTSAEFSGHPNKHSTSVCTPSCSWGGPRRSTGQTPIEQICIEVERFKCAFENSGWDSLHLCNWLFLLQFPQCVCQPSSVPVNSCLVLVASGPPGLHTPPKFHDQQEREKRERKQWREWGKKKREILGLPPCGAPLFLSLAQNFAFFCPLPQQVSFFLLSFRGPFTHNQPHTQPTTHTTNHTHNQPHTQTQTNATHKRKHTNATTQTRLRGRWGFTRQPENSTTCTERVPAFKNTTQIPREDPQRDSKKEDCGGSGEKTKFLVVPSAGVGPSKSWTHPRKS